MADFITAVSPYIYAWMILAIVAVIAGLIVFAVWWFYRRIRVLTTPQAAQPAQQVRQPAQPGQEFRIELREPHDRQITDRNRAERVFSCAVIAMAILVAPTLFGTFWGWLISVLTMMPGLMLGFACGVVLLTGVADRMFVYNREWSGYVTQDIFRGTMVCYGPGLHFSHVWEQRNKSRNIPFEAITKPFSVSVQTKTSKATPEGNYQWAVNPARMTHFIGVDSASIEEGFIGFIEAFLTRELAGKDTEEARRAIDELNRKLAAEFMGDESTHLATHLSSFEEEFGIFTVSIVLTNIVLPDAVQKTRDAKDEAKALREVMAELAGYSSVVDFNKAVEENKLTPKQVDELRDDAMAISENATKEIRTIRGDLGGAAAAALDRLVGGKS